MCKPTVACRIPVRHHLATIAAVVPTNSECALKVLRVRAYSVMSAYSMHPERALVFVRQHICQVIHHAMPYHNKIQIGHQRHDGFKFILEPVFAASKE